MSKPMNVTDRERKIINRMRRAQRLRREVAAVRRAPPDKGALMLAMGRHELEMARIEKLVRVNVGTETVTMRRVLADVFKWHLESIGPAAKMRDLLARMDAEWTKADTPYEVVAVVKLIGEAGALVAAFDKANPPTKEG